jgi:serine/threonine protein kinase
MNEPLQGTSAPTHDEHRVHKLVNLFRQSCAEGNTPRIEDVLLSATADQRSFLLHQLLLIKLDTLRRRGEQPNLDDYLKRFPDQLALVRTAFVEAGLKDTTTARTALNSDAGLETLAVPMAHGAPVKLESLPRKLGRFQLQSLLGQGGMGAVYKATHLLLQREVAIKVLPPERLASQEAVARFSREVFAVGQLDHPNLVRALDADEIEGQQILVMELVEGKDLEHVVLERGPLSVAAACEVIRQAAQGLAHAHEHGFIHRDVKPSNLMLTRDGSVKVLDLGLAGLRGDMADKRDLTATGSIMGTPNYMAPEQAEDTKLADERSDIYGLGCTLFFLLTGRPPYEGDTWLRKILAHRNSPIPMLSAIRPDVPSELDELFRTSVAKDPVNRFASAGELLDRLNHVAISLNDSAESGTSDMTALLAPNVSDSTDTVGSLGTIHRRSVPTNDARPSAVKDSRPRDRSRPVATQPLVAEEPIQAAQSLSTQSMPAAARRPPLFGGNRGWLAIALLPVVILGAIFTFQTPQGTIEIELGEGVESDSIELAIKQQGRTVQVADDQQGWVLQLREGKYDLQINGATDKFQLSEDSVTVTRGGKLLVKVSKIPQMNAAPDVAAAPPKASEPMAARVEGDDAPTAQGWSNWVDVLREVDPRRDTIRGPGWNLVEAGLFGDSPETSPNSGSSTKLQLPVQLKGEYELEVAFTRTAGKSDIHFTLPIADAAASVVTKIDLMSLEGVEGTECRPKLGSDKRHKLTFKIELPDEDAIITVWLDDETVAKWRQPRSKLSVRDMWRTRDPQSPGLGVFLASSVFHTIRVRAPVGTFEVTQKPDLRNAKRVNLIRIANPARDAVKGTWSHANGELAVTEGNGLMGFPYNPPEEFDFAAEFTLEPKNSHRVGLVFPYREDRPAMVSLFIDGNGQLSWATKKEPGSSLSGGLRLQVEEGRRFTLRVEVRRDRVVFYSGDKSMTIWENGQDFGPGWSPLEDRAVVGIECNRDTVFHRVEVIEVTGEGQLTRDQ